MRTESYAAFSLRLHQRVAAQRVPVSGTIEVTRRCPLACIHCYCNLPMDDQDARRSELTYEEHCRILDEIADAGCMWLLYTGGEIFARKDFLDIYTYAKRKGLLITLFTNGTLMTPEVADHLVRWRPFSIEITLYGRTRETYERLTGVPGSFDKCMRGIDLLKERRLPLKLKSVVVTGNRQEIWEIKRFVEEDLELEFRFDAMMNPRIDCSLSPLAVRLTPEEVVALDLQDSKRVAEWKRFAARFNDPTRAPESCSELYNCGGAVTSFAVDPAGKMSLCSLSQRDTYDLRRGSFREGWGSFLSLVRRKPSTRVTKCTACGIMAMCGMCPAYGELENGDPESPVDFLCRVAHLRAQAMYIAIPPHGECEYCEGGAGYDGLMQSLASLRNGGAAVGGPKNGAGIGCSSCALIGKSEQSKGEEQ